MNKIVSSIITTSLSTILVCLIAPLPLMSFVHPLTPCSSKFVAKNHRLYSVKLPAETKRIDSIGASFIPGYVLISTDSSILVINTPSKSTVLDISTSTDHNSDQDSGSKLQLETFAFAKDNSKLLLVFNKKVSLFDLKTKTSTDLNFSDIISCDFSYDGKYIAFITKSSKSIHLVSTDSLKEIKTWNFNSPDFYTNSNLSFFKLTFVTKDSLIFSIRSISDFNLTPSILALLDMKTGKVRTLSKDLLNPVYTLFYPSKTPFYSFLDEYGNILSLDKKDNSIISKLYHPGFSFEQSDTQKLLSFSPDTFLSTFSKHRYLISGNTLGNIKIWKNSTKEVLKDIRSDESVKALAYSCEDVFIVVDDGDGYSIYVLNAKDLLVHPDHILLGANYFKTLQEDSK